MIRLSRLTDYGIVLLTRMATRPDREVHKVRDLAEETGVPRPTVSKVLKSLGKEGLLSSQRGVQGGYSLARPPEEITLAEIIGALEGPIALTECDSEFAEACTLEDGCPARPHWQIINRAVRDALEGVRLSEMAGGSHAFRG